MSVPRIKLRKRKLNKSTTYFLDYSLNGKRYRESAGTNKKLAEELRQIKEARMTLGLLSADTISPNIISLEEAVKEFLSSKNVIRKT